MSGIKSIDYMDIEETFDIKHSELISRKEIVAMTGVSKSKINNVTKSKFLDFPKPAGKRVREEIWKKSDIIKWLETHNIHADLPSLTLNDNPSQSTLDNKLAAAFLTAKRPREQP